MDLSCAQRTHHRSTVKGPLVLMESSLCGKGSNKMRRKHRGSLLWGEFFWEPSLEWNRYHLNLLKMMMFHKESVEHLMSLKHLKTWLVAGFSKDGWLKMKVWTAPKRCKWIKDFFHISNQHDGVYCDEHNSIRDDELLNIYGWMVRAWSQLAWTGRVWPGRQFERTKISRMYIRRITKMDHNSYLSSIEKKRSTFSGGQGSNWMLYQTVILKQRCFELRSTGSDSRMTERLVVGIIDKPL